MSAAAPIIAGFVAALRRAGLAVPVGAGVAYAEALDLVGLTDRDPVYWAGRATLIIRPEDIAAYDDCFERFWRGTPGAAVAVEEQRVTLAVDDGSADDDHQEPGTGDPELQLRYSAVEVLRNKDFAAYSADERRDAEALMARLRWQAGRRRGHRLSPSHRRSVTDLRATMRASLRSSGEPVRRHWRAPRPRLRRLVLLVDISGSMDAYGRALLRFVQAAVAGRARVEAFTIGTRLTRLTAELRTRDPDRALDRAAATVDDWSGGTRLGACLRQFNDQWGVRGLARQAIVVIMSDGWDRGDPAVLAEQMQRLQRVAHRVVWVNPLKVSPGYAPLARGMAAALPFVDDFVEGHSLAAMEHLADVIGDSADRPTRGARHA